MADTGSFDTLRTEIVESQKIRSDLLKWKLLICAAVGAAGLGFSDKSVTNAPLALAVIPLACVYVDLLCRHLSLRIHAIGCFLRSDRHSDEVLRAYETFYQNSRLRVSLEDLALIGCTVLVSVLVYPLGVLASAIALWSLDWRATVFLVSSGLGILLSFLLQIYYVGMRKNYENVAAEFLARAS